jgi:CPA2 family monovalent cation:H+ antiporter-2
VAVELFVEQAVIVLAAATLAALASARFGAPAIVGFLLAGVLIGPAGFGLVPDRERVAVFAEMGVVFLLFGIGLEFSRDRLREVRRAFFVGGSLQAVLTAGAAALFARSFTAGVGQAVIVGMIVMLSSTAIVLKLYAERRELETPAGKLLIGILLFQDFALVPIMVLLPLLAGATAASPLAVAWRLAAGVAAVGAVFAVAWFAMPRLLEAIVRTRVREVLVLGSVALCLASALATSMLGFSLALGAFVAGIVLAESDYSHQVTAEVSPLRDVFNSVFFVSVGMLLDLEGLAHGWSMVLAATLAVVALKAAAGTAAVGLMGYPLRVAAIVGLSLAQVGEFSFVLLEAARRLRAISAELHARLLGAAILSMLLTPLLVALSRRLPGLGRSVAAAAQATGSQRPHVVLVGFGVAGRNIARVLRSAGIPYVVVELDPRVCEEARRGDEPVLFGDATRRDILENAGIERAEVAVFVISDREALRRSVRFARQLAPRVRIVVRTRLVAEIDELRRAGADEVIAEEFETSIEIFTRVLQYFHVPGNVIRAETRLLRQESYRMLRSPGSAAIPEAVLDVLAAGTTDVFRLSSGSPWVGRTLRELDLRQRAGATVIALVRGERPLTNPAPETVIEERDALVLVGSHAEIEAAFAVLEAPALAGDGDRAAS